MLSIASSMYSSVSTGLTYPGAPTPTRRASSTSFFISSTLYWSTQGEEQEEAGKRQGINQSWCKRRHDEYGSYCTVRRSSLSLQSKVCSATRNRKRALLSSYPKCYCKDTHVCGNSSLCLTLRAVSFTNFNTRVETTCRHPYLQPLRGRLHAIVHFAHSGRQTFQVPPVVVDALHRYPPLWVRH